MFVYIKNICNNNNIRHADMLACQKERRFIMTKEELKQAWAKANDDFNKPPLELWNIMVNLGVKPDIESWYANHN